MTQLLTIAIPTYNRANLLDQQLAWLARSIKGFESVCEILISDNCSTDDTPKIVEKWQSVFHQTTFEYNRNQENIGAVRNIASCIQSAKSKFVWTISDDDKIFDNSISYIVKTLTEDPDLGLIILNFSKSDAKTGQVFEQRCFNVEKDLMSSDGKEVFEVCVEQSTGGVGLTTALVYKTDLAKSAIASWTSGLNNLVVQIYWTAFCASKAGALVTKDNYLECVAGTHYFMQKPKLLVTLEYADIPEVMLKLREIGFSHSFSRKMVLMCFAKFNWRVFVGALRRWPVVAIQAMTRYLSYVYLSTLKSSSNSLSIAPSIQVK
ncbi:glycosyltransferase family 2 protein [Iningainema tapete]|uniref:Glycosyltransferase family 2 protein n=1 Tax=Iningainema tapete BLCC-T55 TaxID=2748662 RepID=A0A8J7C6I5_9CYAN|nr:glycosyltransferase family A protein [Iningainema tapete]MBD2774374.1 glycosyltransferase family 2 protein [Iningainema tapete BLCC-T55]